jgi:DNA primase
MSEEQAFTEDEFLNLLYWAGFDNRRTPRGGSISGICPIHEGAENPNGFVAYFSRSYGKHGHFICFTSGCLQSKDGKHDGGDIFDVVAACLDRDRAHKRGCTVEGLKERAAFKDAKYKIEEILGRKIDGFKREKLGFHDYIRTQISKVSAQPTVEMHVLAESLLDDYKHFHPYMLNRGFGRETLRDFEVGYDPKSERVTFPLRDIKGNIVAISRRVVDEAKVTKLNPKYRHDSFSKGEHLYNLYYVKQLIENDPEGLTKLIHPGIIIVEGQVDAIRLHQLGFPLVVAVGGSSLTPHQGMLLES